MVAFSTGATHALAHNAPIHVASSALLMIYAMGLTFWVWTMVGIWRTADRK